ncbi:MAG TPA: tetratricopeptide repeat protein [Candidatus Acidoferrales bacterium]|nr:tetratricopeptide repeat protein [Candidatus Acidoferrales bacterium]
MTASLLYACSGGGAPRAASEGPGPTRQPPGESPRQPRTAPGATAGADLGTAATSPTARQIARLELALASNPNSGDSLLELGLALLQRVRETADPSLYPRAEEALDRARNLAPDDPLPIIGLGTLALARHQFAQGLELGRQALRLGPGLSTAQGVVVDALVELGRYPEALDAVQRMVDERPDLASFARVSYVRELYGDLPGALDAMRRAVQAGGSASENNAYVIVLYGNLLALSGRRVESAQAYTAALAAVPDFPAALAGQGRLAVAAGDLPTALARFARAAAIVPLPEYVIALGETQEASGDVHAAADSYDLAGAETALFQANGVVVDLELALFEADHGSAATALTLAQAAYADRPTLRAADVLAWALFKNGRLSEARRMSAEALRLGTQDPVLLYHAGVIAAAALDKRDAIADLRAALALDPGFSPTAVVAARRLLASLAG